MLVSLHILSINGSRGGFNVEEGDMSIGQNGFSYMTIMLATSDRSQTAINLDGSRSVMHKTGARRD